MKRMTLVFLAVASMMASGLATADEKAEESSTDLSFHEKLKKGIVGYRSTDFSMLAHARVQGWAGWVGEDALLSAGDFMQEPGFRLRRARLGIDGTFARNFSYELELDLYDQERAGGPLYAAWIDYTPTHFFGFTLGVTKLPFMKSEVMSSKYLPHLDRALGTTAMAPANVMGLTLHTEPWKDHLRIEIGVFNGMRRKANFYEGYEGTGVSLGNRFEGLALAARIDLEPLGKMGSGLADVEKSNKFRLGIGVGGYLNGNDWLTFADGGSVATDGISTHLHLKIAGFHLFGEYAREWVFPKPQPTTEGADFVEIQRHVANVSLGYVILKETLGFALRVEYIDSNLSELEAPDGTTDTEGAEFLITGTVNYYIVGEFLKAQLEFTHRRELDDVALANDRVIAGLVLHF